MCPYVPYVVKIEQREPLPERHLFICGFNSNHNLMCPHVSYVVVSVSNANKAQRNPNINSKQPYVVILDKQRAPPQIPVLPLIAFNIHSPNFCQS